MKCLSVPLAVVFHLTMHCIDLASARAEFVTFGSGGNTFTMEFVEVGNPGNTADTTESPSPAGAVSYAYQIGKYEVSRNMIDLYNSNYGTANGLAISMQDMTSYGGNGANKPATGISWNEAARFVNWLNTSQGYSEAYKFSTSSATDNIELWTSGDAGYDASNPYRNSNANYVLPSTDEFYKAAFYDPSGSAWFDYATSDGSVPTAVSSGTTVNTAVFNEATATGPADVDQAGGLNAYGIMGLSGNVYELEESSFAQTNSSPTLNRSRRGGSWATTNVNYLSSSLRSGNPATLEKLGTGFRVVSLTAAVPEPRLTVPFFFLGAAGLIVFHRRRDRVLASNDDQKGGGND